jgi:hypothetical protein
MHEFPQENIASSVLAKIGNGSADADFARALGLVLDRVQATGKKGKLVLTLEVTPRSDLGVVEMRASVEAKVPKLPAPASQMHVGPNGEILSQMDWMMGGGKSETHTPISPPSSSSQRLTVAAAPAPAPIAAAPALAPVTKTHSKLGNDAGKVE